MTYDRTRELVARLAGTGFFPAAARAQIDRSLGGELVVDFALQTRPTLMNGDFVSTEVAVTLLTDTRLLQVAWLEAPEREDQDESGDLAEMSRALGAATPPARPALRVSSRTQSLRSIADVRTTMQFAPDDVEDPGALQEVKVVVLSKTLDRFVVNALECTDPECIADHGYAGTAQQDLVAITANTEHDTPTDLDDLLRFAASLAQAIA